MTKNDQLMIRARRLDPVAGNAFEGIATSYEGKQLLSAILSTDASVEAPKAQVPRGQRISHRRLRLRVAAGLAALLAAAMAIVSINEDRRGGSQVVDVARGPLASAALIAAREARVVLRDGDYMYLHLEGHGTGTIKVDRKPLTALLPTETEVWINNDHSGRIITHTGQPKFVSEEDRAVWEAAGRPEFSDVGTEDRTFASGELFPEVDLNSYPTDPDELYATLLDETRARSNEQERHEYVFIRASDLLFRFPEAAPELRSALFEVLRKVPGTVVRDNGLNDGNGHSAVVSLTVGEDETSQRRRDVYFDPDTAQVVGFQELVLHDADSGGAGDAGLRSNAVLLEWGIVGSMRKRP